MCEWPGKTSGAIRFPLTFSPFLVKQKGMAYAAKEREEISERKTVRERTDINALRSHSHADLIVSAANERKKYSFSDKMLTY